MQIDKAQIDVWKIPLRRASGDLELLGSRELERACRLKVDSKRDQFVAAQAALRRILSSYLRQDAGTINFVYGPNGKPELDERPELGFNLTHSGSMALVAVGRHARIGVDIEYQMRDRPFVRLARRFFSEPEHRWLSGLPESEQRRGFYRTWVLKEAYLKAVGVGLRFAPSRFQIDFESHEPTLVWTELADDHPSHWRFAELAIASEYRAAICWEGNRRTVRVRTE